jgi:hypothetical protein
MGVLRGEESLWCCWTTVSQTTSRRLLDTLLTVASPTLSGIYADPPQREESIAKRRNFQPAAADDSLDSDDDVDLGTQSLDATLTQMLQDVYSNDQTVQLESTTRFRK